MSTTDGWLKLYFASCVVLKTRSLCALVLRSVCYMVFVNYAYDMVVDTQFHKFHGRPFTRVLYVFLMKDIGRWLPWVPPGSTGRFYKDDVVHNHSAYGYYITRMEGGVIYAWYCCYMLKIYWNTTCIWYVEVYELKGPIRVPHNEVFFSGFFRVVTDLYPS